MTRPSFSLLAKACIALVVIGGCSPTNLDDDDGGTSQESEDVFDAGLLADGGTPFDAGASSADAGRILDAGSQLTDAGPSLDAGIRRADSGSFLDAGVPPMDAGSVVDAGIQQADAGTISVPAGQIVVPSGAVWKYWASENPPDATWRESDFDDATWLEGETGIGYGDGDDQTVLTDMAGNYITLYTRVHFVVADANSTTAFKLSVRVDDGFVAYLNGIEIGRFNMPAGDITHTTGASTSIDANRTQEIIAANPSFLDGDNVLAVEIHNQSIGSSDLSFIPQVTVGFGIRPDFLKGFQEEIAPTSIPFVVDNLSGATLNSESGTYFLIENGVGNIWEVSETFELIRTISSSGFGDSEDLVWLDGDDFAIVNEGGKLFIGPIAENTSSIDASEFQEVTFAEPAGNVGPEGVAYDAQEQVFYVVKEKNPRRIYRFDRPALTGNVAVVPTEPFDAEEVFLPYASDLSAVVFAPSTGRLLVLSDEDQKIMDVGLDGFIYDEYVLPSGEQWEGLTLSTAGGLVVVGEPNVRAYLSPN